MAGQGSGWVRTELSIVATSFSGRSPHVASSASRVAKRLEVAPLPAEGLNPPAERREVQKVSVSCSPKAPRYGEAARLRPARPARERARRSAPGARAPHRVRKHPPKTLTFPERAASWPSQGRSRGGQQSDLRRLLQAGRQPRPGDCRPGPRFFCVPERGAEVIRPRGLFEPDSVSTFMKERMALSPGPMPPPPSTSSCWSLIAKTPRVGRAGARLWGSSGVYRGRYMSRVMRVLKRRLVVAALSAARRSFDGLVSIREARFWGVFGREKEPLSYTW